MRRLIAIILLWCSTLAVVCAQQGIVFDGENHNFGKIEESGGVVSHTFKYTNNSDTPYVIIDVVTGCGCTTPEYSKKPVLPGQSGEITVTFDPMYRPGRILKRITITSNLGVKELTIDGTVNERELTLEEKYPFIIGGGARLDVLSYSGLEVPKGESLKVLIGVANNNTKSAVELEIDQANLPKGVKANFTKSKLEPKSEAKLEIEISGEEYEFFQYGIPLIINGKRGVERVLLAGAVVDNFRSWSRSVISIAPRVALSKSIIRGGVVELGSEQEYSLEVSNSGKSALEVREMWSSGGLEVNLSSKSIAAGGKAIMRVRYKAKQEGYDSQIVKLILNDPQKPVVELRLVAEVRE